MYLFKYNAHSEHTTVLKTIIKWNVDSKGFLLWHEGLLSNLSGIKLYYSSLNKHSLVKWNIMHQAEGNLFVLTVSVMSLSIFNYCNHTGLSVSEIFSASLNPPHIKVSDGSLAHSLYCILDFVGKPAIESSWCGTLGSKTFVFL